MPKSKATSDSSGDVLLEFQWVGNLVKVSAVDPVTATEVSIQGPASTEEWCLRRAAVQKLRYVLRQRETGAW